MYSRKDDVARSNSNVFPNEKKYVIFLSVSDGKTRAIVTTGVAESMELAWLDAEKKCLQIINQQRMRPIWIKADVVINMKLQSKHTFFQTYHQVEKRHLRKGISLDRSFNLAFLEQELSANVFLEEQSFSIDTMLDYLKTYRHYKERLRESDIKEIIIFDTVGVFCDKRNVYPLHSGGLSNGRRKVSVVDQAIIQQMIDTASIHLANKVKLTGEFSYDFNQSDDIHRLFTHASTIYAMIKAYAITKNPMLEKAIKRALNYLVHQKIVYRKHPEYGTVAYVVDKKKGYETALGVIAITVIAITMYEDIFNDQSFRFMAESLGHGILSLQQDNGLFHHIVKVKDFNIKQAYRNAVYDEMTIYALLKLYEVEHKDKWLNRALLSFDRFIEEKTEQPDYWLSYCANEITKYRPEDNYFTFCLQQMSTNLADILKKATSNPIYLELLMSTEQLIQRIKGLQKEYLLEEYPVEYFTATIHQRAKHQLDGYFFPELAMYMEEPQKVNGTFYIKNRSFRMKFDDIAHYISSYHYYYQKVLQIKKD
ncbi:hypothetical protein SH601_05810 [Gracilibacillus sp. S3-1-1]|uniref:Uncharacterized protein n=1 Tax=Gracilibacillus pellucidus TaxID=3095368 RepID=A0ACC6M3L8_9BACI|nr:hypothetical protein [Gracilibacillus sp. S3-1-1]MDX8045498.1 hypothetical protein [Gracilibacillus sp. S3-1-1]